MTIDRKIIDTVNHQCAQADLNSNAVLKQLVSTLDLTSLNDNDSEQDILSLCEQGQTTLGTVAAVCVYPKFLSFVFILSFSH